MENDPDLSRVSTAVSEGALVKILPGGQDLNEVLRAQTKCSHHLHDYRDRFGVGTDRDATLIVFQTRSYHILF